MDLKYGIVESVEDELESGRVKVRVFGVHTANKKVLPTDDLPSARVMTGGFVFHTHGSKQRVFVSTPINNPRFGCFRCL